MADNDDEFVIAQGPNGDKRRVPKHYLDNPAFGFKLPPSARAKLRTDEEGEAVTPISGAVVPPETTEVDVTKEEPKKEVSREGRR